MLLKITKGKDLKELEKFGFKEFDDCYRLYILDAEYYVYKRTRKITLYVSDWEGLSEKNSQKVLKVFYDLTREGFVEEEI